MLLVRLLELQSVGLEVDLKNHHYFHSLIVVIEVAALVVILE